MESDDVAHVEANDFDFDGDDDDDDGKEVVEASGSETGNDVDVSCEMRND